MDDALLNEEVQASSRVALATRAQLTEFLALLLSPYPESMLARVSTVGYYMEREAARMKRAHDCRTRMSHCRGRQTCLVLSALPPLRSPRSRPAPARRLILPFAFDCSVAFQSLEVNV
jgi:hypothetical protein